MTHFFDDIQVIKKRVRASDPVSSVQAAERSTRFSETHKGRILAAMERLGGSATAHEISLATGLSTVQVDRRVCEIERAGLIEFLRDDSGDCVTRNGFRVMRLVCE